MLFDLPLQATPDELDRYAATMTKRDQRPSAALDIVLRTAAKKLAPAVVKWLKEGDDKAEDDEIAKELAEIIEPHDDGYALAKKLDRKGWDCDSNLVDILDGAWALVYDTHMRLLKGWVEAHHISLDLPIGARVTTPRGTGEIVEHRAEAAMYLVHMPEKGHVKGGPGTHGIYFRAEEVSAITAEV